MKIPGFGKDNKQLQPQKKLVSLKFFDLFNGLVKAESDYKDSTESSLIENKVLDTYLSDDSRLAEIIANNLMKKNGIMICSSKIMDLYKNSPALANDSLLSMLELLSSFIQRHDVHHKTTDAGIDTLAKYATEYMNYIKERYVKDTSYSFYEANGKTARHLNEMNLKMLQDVADADKSQHRLDNENIFYVCLRNVITFWNFGGDAHSPSLKNWSMTYEMLKAAFDLYELPDYPPYNFEFTQAVKEITMDEKAVGTFDPKNHLTKHVFLGHKSFITTEDAVILKSEENQPDGFFNNAYRIIHGHGGPAPQRPYIILCNNESEPELNNIIREKVASYPEEFPDPNDIFFVQFLFEGIYYDNRIKWSTI